jgi:hypothetical protein
MYHLPGLAINLRPDPEQRSSEADEAVATMRQWPR